MAGPRGYSSYRGRVSKLKVALAVLLVLVIFAAGAVIYLQRYCIVYDEEGRPVMKLPWLEENEPPPSNIHATTEPEDPVVVIADPVEPPPEEVETILPLTIFSLPSEALTAAKWEAAFAAKPENGNAVVLTMKDSAGVIYYDAAGAVSGAVKTQADTAAALAAVTGQEDLYTIARLGCLHDSRAAKADVNGRGLKNTGGYIFYDQKNTQWLDPSKQGTRDYLAGMAQELAAMGFDEILLTDVSYPTAGKLTKIAYGDIPKEENLAGLVEALHTALEPYDVALSIEVSGSTVSTGKDEVAGINLAKILPWVDRVYAESAAENVETYQTVLSLMAEDVVFVPELAADDPTVTGDKWVLTS
ncbi:MAG: hypothetical protein HFF84_08660 [Oscillibacter sp.]|nr:hypothetical protein [Oscillibacter sp.]